MMSNRKPVRVTFSRLNADNMSAENALATKACRDERPLDADENPPGSQKNKMLNSSKHDLICNIIDILWQNLRFN